MNAYVGRYPSPGCRYIARLCASLSEPAPDSVSAHHRHPLGLVGVLMLQGSPMQVPASCCQVKCIGCFACAAHLTGPSSSFGCTKLCWRLGSWFSSMWQVCIQWYAAQVPEACAECWIPRLAPSVPVWPIFGYVCLPVVLLLSASSPVVMCTIMLEHDHAHTGVKVPIHTPSATLPYVPYAVALIQRRCLVFDQCVCCDCYQCVFKCRSYVQC